MTKANAKALGERMQRYFLEESELPSFVRFAAKEGMTVHELRKLCEKYKALAIAYEESVEILCDRIAIGALFKRLDGSFAKFLLSERYGYTEKGEAEEEALGVKITLSEPDA